MNFIPKKDITGGLQLKTQNGWLDESNCPTTRKMSNIIAFVPIAAKDWVYAFKNHTCMNSFVEQLQSNLEHSSDKQLADIITQTIDDNEQLFDQEVLPFFRSDYCRLIERRFNLL